MSTPDNQTAEQFIRQAVRGLINRQAEDAPACAVDALIAEIYGDADPQLVCRQLMVNSVAARLAEAERAAVSDANKWILVGQLDLWGTRPFRLPETFLRKSIQYACDHMEQLWRLDDEKAEEAIRAGRALKDRANERRDSFSQLDTLRQSVEKSGLDPCEVYVDEAIQQAEAFRDRSTADADTDAEWNVRRLRIPTHRGDRGRPSDSVVARRIKPTEQPTGAA